MASLQELTQIACQIRQDIISSLAEAKSGHPGGSLSAVEILTALYFEVLRVNPEHPAWENRDRFVLAKGHAAPALYATLAAKGFFPTSELKTLRRLGSRLQGHPDALKTPGVDLSTGSLGQGLSAAVGMALAARYLQLPTRVYALLGDGELQEGQVWEAAMSASHYQLGGLVAIIDHNGLQIDGPLASVLNPMPLDAKFAAFGWEVISCDGHSFPELLTALAAAQKSQEQPTVIIAQTVKGKGVKFMEGDPDWHGKALTADDAVKALAQLQQSIAAKEEG
ncbi:MAG: transketolase [Symbiobacteriaceae bacterium]|nr:transketolase [Symbiobacteriaceae bacterium]